MGPVYLSLTIVTLVVIVFLAVYMELFNVDRNFVLYHEASKVTLDSDVGQFNDTVSRKQVDTPETKVYTGMTPTLGGKLIKDGKKKLDSEITEPKLKNSESTGVTPTLGRKLIKDGKDTERTEPKLKSTKYSPIWFNTSDSAYLDIVPKRAYYDNRKISNTLRNLVVLLVVMMDSKEAEESIVSCELNGFYSKVKVIREATWWVRKKYPGYTHCNSFLDFLRRQLVKVAPLNSSTGESETPVILVWPLRNRFSS